MTRPGGSDQHSVQLQEGLLVIVICAGFRLQLAAATSSRGCQCRASGSWAGRIPQRPLFAPHTRRQEESFETHIDSRAARDPSAPSPEERSAAATQGRLPGRLPSTRGHPTRRPNPHPQRLGPLPCIAESPLPCSAVGWGGAERTCGGGVALISNRGARRNEQRFPVAPDGGTDGKSVCGNGRPDSESRERGAGVRGGEKGIREGGGGGSGARRDQGHQPDSDRRARPPGCQ